MLSIIGKARGLNLQQMRLEEGRSTSDGRRPAIENNFAPDLIVSLFSNQFGTTNQPYTNIEIPGQIFAVDYDIENQGVSYLIPNINK